MEKKDEHLALSISSHIHTQTHTGVCPHSHTLRPHTYGHPLLGRRERSWVRDATVTQWGVQLWVGILWAVSLSGSHTCPGKATPPHPEIWGRLGRNVRHTLLGRRTKCMLHAQMRVSEEAGFLFPLACSVSLERWGRNETKKGRKERKGKTKKMMTIIIIIKDNHNK